VPNAISMDAFIHFLNLGFADGNKITSLGWIIKAVIGSDQTYWQEFPMLIAAPITMIIILGVIFFIIARILADALDPRNHR
jgi:oligopeptide transport system permease protein